MQNQNSIYGLTNQYLNKISLFLTDKQVHEKKLYKLAIFKINTLNKQIKKLSKFVFKILITLNLVKFSLKIALKICIQ